MINRRNPLCRAVAVVATMAAVAVSAVLSGCSKNDDLIPNQQQSIVGFLTGSHQPRLLSEEDARNSLDENPPYYTQAGNTAYRYIADSYNPDRLTRKEVAAGDAVTITFRAYIFEGRAIGATTIPYYTNDPSLRTAYEQSGLDPQYWTFEPLRIVLGETPILKGVEISLAGCREGDAVEVYMTCNMAYGDKKEIGVIPKQSPIAFLFTIDSVEKK